MNIVEDFKNPSAMSLPVKLAYLLLFAALLWMTSAPLFVSRARAYALTTFSDTLYDSSPNTFASSTIAFVNNSIIVAGQSIKVQFDPLTQLFTEFGSSATTSQIYMTVGGSDYDIVSVCTAGNQVTAAANYSPGVDENLTFTLCAAATNIATSSSVVIGISSGLISNPASTGSYVIRISTNGPGLFFNTGDTRVAIIDNVKVTASVDTTLTFTISGVATSTTFNGTTTTDGSTATLIPFINHATGGSLVPNQPEVAAQRLNVSTNASQGFTVTVHAGNPGSANGGDLTSSGGDDIDFFKDGTRNPSPTAWTAPLNTLNNEQTYGHFGLTTTDNGGDPGVGSFGSDQWVGNFNATSARAVMYNGGPSDGVADNIGSTTVGYAIQIGSLQQAGTDYQTTFTYVATPIF